ncbi:MAG: universal stress protein [Casimicrobiaceae bacterium]
MKILFPTDGSAHSIAALRNVLAHLAWFADAPEIVLINVHPPLPYARAVAWAGKEAVARYYADECAAALAPAISVLAEHGICGEEVTKIGDPAHEIARYAAESNADLVAMARHGHSGIAGLLMGSVAQKVLAIIKLPVLLLP